VVLLDRPGSPAQCSVAVDDRRGGEIAVTYLLGLGHRSIALVNGPTAIRQCADRRWGAYRAVEHAGLLLDEADRPAEHEHRRIVFTPELVVRASSGSRVSVPSGPGAAVGRADRP
jgi:DNA-binding LacI/PurR family transcriptional regulator